MIMAFPPALKVLPEFAQQCLTARPILIETQPASKYPNIPARCRLRTHETQNIDIITHARHYTPPLHTKDRWRVVLPHTWTADYMSPPHPTPPHTDPSSSLPAHSALLILSFTPQDLNRYIRTTPCTYQRRRFLHAPIVQEPQFPCPPSSCARAVVNPASTRAVSAPFSVHSARSVGTFTNLGFSVGYDFFCVGAGAVAVDMHPRRKDK